jgi:hypothetical protein
MDLKANLIANNKLVSLFSNNANVKARNTLKKYNLMLVHV